MKSDNVTDQNPVCPICFSDSFKTLYEVTSELSVEHLGADPESERGIILRTVVKELWGSDKCYFIQCQHCSFIYAYPFVSGNEKFYSHVYHNHSYYNEWKWEYQVTYENIKSFIVTDKMQNLHLLEIGAGNGAFIKRISRDLIPKQNILCTEFSEYGKKEIVDYGIDCITENLKNLDPEKIINKFDIICIFQVLEHIDHLKETFENLNKIINDDARLYISVPNDKHRMFYDAHGSHFDIPPTHISRWNYNSFKAFGEKYGWIILQHRYQPQSVFDKLKKFMFNRYRYFKRISFYIDQINLPIFNKLLKLTTFAIFFIIYFYSMMKLIFGPFGISQWICFIKKSNNL